MDDLEDASKREEEDEAKKAEKELRKRQRAEARAEVKEAKKRQKLEEKRAREAAEKNAAKKKFFGSFGAKEQKREAAVSANNTSGGNGETVRKLVEEEYVDEKGYFVTRQKWVEVPIKDLPLSERPPPQQKPKPAPKKHFVQKSKKGKRRMLGRKV